MGLCFETGILGARDPQEPILPLTLAAWEDLGQITQPLRASVSSSGKRDDEDLLLGKGIRHCVRTARRIGDVQSVSGFFPRLDLKLFGSVLPYTHSKGRRLFSGEPESPDSQRADSEANARSPFPHVGLLAFCFNSQGQPRAAWHVTNTFSAGRTCQQLTASIASRPKECSLRIGRCLGHGSCSRSCSWSSSCGLGKPPPLLSVASFLQLVR